MARYYSEYEIAKADKQLNTDLLNNDKYKKDLKIAINEENHRSNVDRAKKKAVSQYMDYDNFHQMVLGADLHNGMNLNDVIDIKPEKAILNSISENKEFENKVKNDLFLKNFVNDDNKKVINFKNDDEITIQKFKKNFKNFNSVDDKINYIFNNVNIEKFKELFNVNIIDSDLFSDLIYNFGLYLNNLNEINDKSKFLIECLNIIENAVYFNKLKMFIGKKHKNIYNEIIEKKTFENSIEIFNKIINK
jgi:hypothetical protein